MGLQTFADNVPTTGIGGLANQNTGTSSFSNAGSAINSFASSVNSSVRGDAAAARAQLKLNEVAKEQEASRKTAIDEIQSELIERESVLSEAVEAGSFSADEAGSFGQDLESSLESLRQAESKGMSNSVRAALQRSILWQNSVMLDPSRVSDISAAFGIDHTKSGSGSLAEQQKAEKQEEQRQLANAASDARDVMDTYGETHIGLSDSEVVAQFSGTDSAVLSSRAAKLAANIKRAEGNITLQTINVDKALSTRFGTDNQQLWEIAGPLLQEGTFAAQSGPQLLNQFIAGVESELRVNYPNQTASVTSYISSLRTVADRYTKSVSDVNAISAEDFRIRNLLPLELANKQLGLELRQNEVSNIGVNNSRLFANTSNSVTEAIISRLTIAQEADRNIGNSGRIARAFQEANSGDINLTASLISAGEEAATAWKKRLDPSFLDGKTAAEGVSDFFLLGIGDPSVFQDDELVLQSMEGLNEYINGDFITPKQRMEVQTAILDLGKEPEFRELLKKSEGVRLVAMQSLPALRARVVGGLRATIDRMVDENVLTAGTDGAVNPYTNWWRKLGPWTVLSERAAEEGRLQFILKSGTSDAVGAGVARKMQEALTEYNVDLARKSVGDLRFLADLVTPDGNIKDALTILQNTPEGASLANLGFGIEAPDESNSLEKNFNEIMNKADIRTIFDNAVEKGKEIDVDSLIKQISERLKNDG